MAKEATKEAAAAAREAAAAEKEAARAAAEAGRRAEEDKKLKVKSKQSSAFKSFFAAAPSPAAAPLTTPGANSAPPEKLDSQEADEITAAVAAGAGAGVGAGPDTAAAWDEMTARWKAARATAAAGRHRTATSATAAAAAAAAAGAAAEGGGGGSGRWGERRKSKRKRHAEFVGVGGSAAAAAASLADAMDASLDSAGRAGRTHAATHDIHMLPPTSSTRAWNPCSWNQIATYDVTNNQHLGGPRCRSGRVTEAAAAAGRGLLVLAAQLQAQVRLRAGPRGKALQLDPVKPNLKAPGFWN